MVDIQIPVPTNETGRPGWDDYFLSICKLIALRSTCLRRKVGAVLIREKRLLATGYNGAPVGLDHCAVNGCERARQNIPSGTRAEICRGLHAEQNVIIQAAYHGVSIAGASLYCTNQPCSICVKMLINAGIAEVVYEDGYPDPLAEKLMQEAEIRVRRIGREEKP